MVQRLWPTRYWNARAFRLIMAGHLNVVVDCRRSCWCCSSLSSSLSRMRLVGQINGAGNTLTEGLWPILSLRPVPLGDGSHAYMRYVCVCIAYKVSRTIVMIIIIIIHLYPRPIAAFNEGGRGEAG